MPGGDRAQRPPLLLGGTNTGGVGSMRGRTGSSLTVFPAASGPDDPKRQAASRLRASDASRSTSATGRALRSSLSTTPTAGIDSNTPDNSMSSGRASSSSTAARGGSTLQKRIGDLVKRAQPHTIVQTYDKILRAVQFDAQLIVNGEALSPDAVGASTLQAGWKCRGKEGNASDVAAGFFDPGCGRFHYALGFRFSHVDPALSLSTITDIAVGASPSVSAMSTCRPCMFTPVIPEESNRPAARSSNRPSPAATSSRSKLSIKTWRLVAETPTRVGLGLYELSLSASPKARGCSSVLALVWTRDHARLEVVSLFAQLHVPELLVNALVVSPSRPCLIIPLHPIVNGDRGGGGGDSTGLRGFTIALTLRTLDRVIWEREWYQVDFSHSPNAGRDGEATCKRTVTAQLLNEHGAFRDRTRYADGLLGLDVVTDAITLAIDSVVVVDFCAWEESAIAPVWGFSRPVRILPSSTQASASTLSGTLGGDFTLTSAGKTHELLEARVVDASNQVTVYLIKTRGAASGEGDRVLVKQVEVAMDVAFVNATFGTSY